jgi:pyruvate carboxylase
MDGIGYSGYTVTPYFDSMIVKYTTRGSTFRETVNRMKRVLQECRIRGVKTNISFLLNVLAHPEFETGSVTTSFIDDHPELKQVSTSLWDFSNEEQADPRKTFASERLLRYLANLAVNGHPPELGVDNTKLNSQLIAPKRPVISDHVTSGTQKSTGWRQILLKDGPEGYAKAVRDHKGLLVTDTTWRDAHQSLLATRMRSRELIKCAEYTNDALSNAFSLEMWGGATFDVAMRFLHECPWERLESLRQSVPDVPFQMLLRGANAVGYTNYPDNIVYKFCDQARKSGIDIFRVFDSLNYLDNLQLGIAAVGKAGGFVEGTMSYTGDVADPSKGKYTLEYYLNLAQKLVDEGVHSLAIKDMAGLLTPRATTMLITALREQHPNIPIHVHTHDTAGSGVASMLAAAAAGADVIDAAIDAMSGLTSQPSLGAIAANLRGTALDTGLDSRKLGPLNDYWEAVRNLYAPFESGQLSGSSDVYQHEIPGGQYTNLLFQSRQLGLTDKWPQIKKKYAEANMVLGDIPKVTPSSKVVGDLAQFMVSQNLDAQNILEQAETLAFPDSVISYLKGDIGVPPGGFPEPLRTRVLSSRGIKGVEGRPGASLPNYDFEKTRKELEKRYGKQNVDEKALLSYALYPKVFEEWKEFEAVYGEVGRLPTHVFLNPMKAGEEFEVKIGDGKMLIVKLVSLQEANEDGTRMVLFEVNGEQWYIPVTDLSTENARLLREKARSGTGDVGSPMSGVIVGVKVKVGDVVQEGETLATLSAMKMETSIPASKSGSIKRIVVNVGDKVDGDDLLMEIE